MIVKVLFLNKPILISSFMVTSGISTDLVCLQKLLENINENKINNFIILKAEIF